METVRKTPEIDDTSSYLLTSQANASRSMTVRLPVDLYEYLVGVANADSLDITKTLISVIRAHRDGAKGIPELARLTTLYGGIGAQVANIESSLAGVNDEISVIRGTHGRTLVEVSETLKLLFALLRDGVEPEDTGPSSLTDAPSGLLGSAEIPVMNVPSSGSRNQYR